MSLFYVEWLTDFSTLFRISDPQIMIAIFNIVNHVTLLIKNDISYPSNYCTLISLGVVAVYCGLISFSHFAAGDGEVFDVSNYTGRGKW